MKTEFRYGLVNRPAGLGCIPNLPYRLEPPMSDEEGRRLTRHGVVVFERALADAEITSFELAPIADEEMKAEIVTAVAGKLLRYAAAYLEQAEQDPDYFRDAVLQKLRKVRPYLVHVGPHVEFVERVRQALQIELEPA